MLSPTKKGCRIRHKNGRQTNNFFSSLVQKITFFWKQISVCLSTLKYSSFNISLKHVIIGWNIHEPEYNIANITLIFNRAYTNLR